MTEASGGGSRAELERRLIQRSMDDEEFRQKLLDDPKGAIEQELGVGFPAEVQVRALQESADTIYLVLPSVSPLGGEGGGSLSDQELEAVAGGGNTIYDPTCGTECNDNDPNFPPPQPAPRRLRRARLCKLGAHRRWTGTMPTFENAVKSKFA